MENIKISLAGDLGSGKSTVGKLLCGRLGAELYSTGTIQRAIAEEMGMTTLELNRYSETHPEIDGRIDDGLRALEHEPKDLIIDSRMAWHFVPSSFSVYMMTEPVISATRILNAGRSSEPFKTVEEAVESIAARRKSEAQRYLQLYGVHIKDLENYDYVVDTSFVSPETVADRIAEHYRKYKAGEKFVRYEICPARLLPAGEGAGAPSFIEYDGFFYIAGGAEEIVRSIARGAPLIACARCVADDPAAFVAENCTREKVAEWSRRTGVRPAALPAFLQP